MTEKTLYFVEVANETKVENYIKKNPETIPVQAENIFDFLNKSHIKDFTEIIFDYTTAEQILQRGQNLDAIKNASLRGAIIKIVQPQGPQNDKYTKHKKEIELLIPTIKEITLN